MLSVFNIFAHDVNRSVRGDVRENQRYVHPARGTLNVLKPSGDSVSKNHEPAETAIGN